MRLNADLFMSQMALLSPRQRCQNFEGTVDRCSLSVNCQCCRLQGEIVSLRSDNVRLNELIARKNISQSTFGLSYRQQQQQQQLRRDARSASVQHITLGEPAANIGSRSASILSLNLPQLGPDLQNTVA